MPNDSLNAFWIVAGINGAGKSTVAQGLQRIIGDMPILNPDAPVKALLHDLQGISLNEANLAAVTGVESIVGLRIENKQAIAVETVLSSNKYVRHASAAKANGLFVGMIYVSVSDVETAISRVRNRASQGGHDVPAQKIRERWDRSHDNLLSFISLTDELYIYSNADPGGEAEEVAYIVGGKIRQHQKGRLPAIDARLATLDG